MIGIYKLRISSTFMRNLQHNKQSLWVSLQKSWQKTNLKLLSVYNEVKTVHIIRYIAMVLMKKTTQHLRIIIIGVGGVATLASILIRDLQGQLQLALTLADTPQRPILVGGECSSGSYN